MGKLLYQLIGKQEIFETLKARFEEVRMTRFVLVFDDFQVFSEYIDVFTGTVGNCQLE